MQAILYNIATKEHKLLPQPDDKLKVINNYTRLSEDEVYELNCGHRDEFSYLCGNRYDEDGNEIENDRDYGASGGNIITDSQFRFPICYLEVKSLDDILEAIKTQAHKSYRLLFEKYNISTLDDLSEFVKTFRF